VASNICQALLVAAGDVPMRRFAAVVMIAELAVAVEGTDYGGGGSGGGGGSFGGVLEMAMSLAGMDFHWCTYQPNLSRFCH
jgi:hypothetical protein